MGKIKKITERLTQNPAEYNAVRFLVARRLFVGTVLLYFLVYLFTVGGFYFWFFSLELFSRLQYHLYSLLIVATFWFIYALADYFISIYSPKNRKPFLFVSAIILLVLMAFPLLAHFHMLSFLLPHS